MKKALLLLIAAMLIFTTACSGSGGRTAPAYGSGNYPTNDTYDPETDNPYYLSGSAASNKVAQTQNGYYFLLYDTLLYTDEETMEPIPVCSKPNCRHHEETDETKRKACNAYFQMSPSAGNVLVSNGQLYVFHRALGLVINDVQKGMFDYALTKVSADGVKRTTILEVQSKFPLMNMIHRGRFYIVIQSTNEQGCSTAELWSYSLDNPKEEPKLLYQSEPLLQTSNIVIDLHAYGTQLYLREYLAASEGGQERVLRIYDLTTNEWTILENPEGYNLGVNAIAGGKLVHIYSPLGASAMFEVGDKAPDLSGPMLVSKLNGSSAEEIAFDTWGGMTADESYIYLRSPRYTQQQTDGSYTYSTPTDSYYFYDTKMNLVDELPLERLASEGDELLSCTIYPMNNEHILIHARYRKHMAFYYFDRSEIGTGEIKPMEFMRYEQSEYLFTNN